MCHVETRRGVRSVWEGWPTARPGVVSLVTCLDQRALFDFLSARPSVEKTTGGPL